jgi:hypothetical protein
MKIKFVNTKNKKPLKPGWYLCHSFWWRWWDGSLWSFGVQAYNTPSVKALYTSRLKCDKFISDDMEWSTICPTMFGGRKHA